MTQYHCASLSASVSHLDDNSSSEDDRPPTPYDIWLSPSSQGGTPRMKRRLQGSGQYKMSPHAVKRRLAQQIEKSGGGAGGSSGVGGSGNAAALSPKISVGRKNVTVNVVEDALGPSSKKLNPAMRAQSKVMMAKVLKEMEQQAELNESEGKPKRTWRNIHRIVEQKPNEPLAIIFFKWFLMIIGAVMVVAAVVIMIGVIHAGASGALRHRRLMKNSTFELQADVSPAGDVLTATLVTS